MAIEFLIVFTESKRASTSQAHDARWQLSPNR